MEDALTSLILERLAIVRFCLLWSVIALSLAWATFYFYLPATILYLHLKFKNVIRAFIAFILAQVLIIPMLIGITFGLLNLESEIKVDFIVKGWLSIFSSLGGFLAVWLISHGLPAHVRHLMWGTSAHRFKDFILGAVSWFISFPLACIIGHTISVIVLQLSNQQPIDQVAVQHIKKIASDPFLLSATFFMVTAIVPITEELLFRGFLQSWLRQKLNHRGWAIGLTSCIFALFHYTPSQGLSNLELIAALIILSVFLGFLYERQHSLWAPIGLHSFFNMISIWMIIKPMDGT